MKPAIIIENIRSTYNVGNIIRTADALGFLVCLSGYTPHPDFHEKVKKTSLGSELSVPLVHYRNTTKSLFWAKEEGYTIISMELTEQSIPLNKIHFSEIKNPVCFVVGNEKTGIIEETINSSDFVCKIPMAGLKESLNVGQAAAIAMREYRSQDSKNCIDNETHL